MPEKKNTAETHKELKWQRDQARERLEKLPQTGGFEGKSLSREKRASVNRQRGLYQKVIARADKILGDRPKSTPPKKKAAPKKGQTPGDKYLGKPIRKATGLEALKTTLQEAAKQGLKKKNKG